MQILKVTAARSIWLFPIAYLNPKGKAIGIDLINWLKNRYEFQKYPSSLYDYDDESQTLTFAGGKFKAETKKGEEERNIIVNLVFYRDGLVANTESSTADGDAFLDDALHSATEEFGLSHPEEIRKKIYYSEMDIRLDRPINLINPKLEKLASRINKLRPEAPEIVFEFSGLNFFPQPDVQTTLSGFGIERKLSTDWSENIYYTRAPLQTDAHIQLLEEFEALLTK